MFTQSVLFISSAISSSVSPELISDLDASIRLDLQRIDDRFFWWVAASAIVVAIGCMMEGPEVLHELWPCTFAVFSGRWVKHVGLVGWLLVVLGVAAEGVFEVYDHHASGLLQTFDETVLTTTQLQTSDAYMRAESARLEADSLQGQVADDAARTKEAEAKVASAQAESKAAAAQVKTADARIAEAQRDAAEATKTAEQERIERLKLEGQVAPRRLTNEEAAGIARGCSLCSGRSASIRSYATDIESAILAKQLVALLGSPMVGPRGDRRKVHRSLLLATRSSRGSLFVCPPAKIFVG